MDQLVRITLPLILVASYYSAKFCSSANDHIPKSNVRKESKSKPIVLKQKGYTHDDLLPYVVINYVKNGCMELKKHGMNVGFNNDEITVMLRSCDFVIAQLIYKYLGLSNPGPLITVLSDKAAAMTIKINTNINKHHQHGVICADGDKYRDASSAGMLCDNAKPLNPNAIDFIPEANMFTVNSLPRYLPPLDEEVDIAEWESMELDSLQHIKQLQLEKFQGLKQRNHRRKKFKFYNVMFIDPEVTAKAVPLIKEYFEDSQKLFQYLRYMLIIKIINGAYRILMERVEYNQVIVLFDVKLHDHDDNTLYVVAMPNDVSDRVETWKMEGFMTEMEILSEYCISTDLLPHSKDDYYGMNIFPIEDNMANLRTTDWSELQIIQSSQQKAHQKGKKSKHKRVKNEVQISIEELQCKVVKAKDDEKSENFKRIVLVDMEEEKYETKPILLVKLDDKNGWIGVEFDFDKETNKWNPKQILIDCVDIKSKMALYQSFKNEDEYKELTNDITNLTVSECEGGCKNCKLLAEENMMLKQLLAARDKTIADLKMQNKVNQGGKL